MTDLFSIEKFDWLWRVLIAHAFVLFLLLVDISNLSISFLFQAKPFFLSMAIYYWAIYRPTLIHPFLIFSYGLIIDLIFSYPLGFHSVLFLVVQYFLKNQRLFFLGQPYLIFWIGFSITLAVMIFVEWLFFSIVSQSSLNFQFLIINYLASVFVFPLASLVFLGIHKLIPINTKKHQ